MAFILGVLITLNLLLTFLTMAAVGRSFLFQRDFNDALAGRINDLTERTEELTEIVEGAMNCLVAEDARLVELIGQEQTLTESGVNAG